MAGFRDFEPKGVIPAVLFLDCSIKARERGPVNSRASTPVRLPARGRERGDRPPFSGAPTSPSTQKGPTLGRTAPLANEPRHCTLRPRSTPTSVVPRKYLYNPGPA